MQADSLHGCVCFEGVAIATNQIMPMLRRLARALLPTAAKRQILLKYGSIRPPTVAAGWDRYARNSRFGVAGGESGGQHLGDQWTTPEVLGVDSVRAEEFLDYLDRSMIAPFFGEGGRVLEIGAGGGRMTQLLVRRCERVIAADTGRTMIRLLQRRFGDNPKVEYMRLDGRGLSQVADASLDKVFSYDVFVHLQPWDIFNYLTEIRRTLKPGGRVIIHHAHTLSPLGWQKFLSDVPINVGRHKTFDSFSVMTQELMRALAEGAGLQVVEQREDIVPRDAVVFLRKPGAA